MGTAHVVAGYKHTATAMSLHPTASDGIWRKLSELRKHVLCSLSILQDVTFWNLKSKPHVPPRVCYRRHHEFSSTSLDGHIMTGLPSIFPAHFSRNIVDHLGFSSPHQEGAYWKSRGCERGLPRLVVDESALLSHLDLTLHV